jgi:2'-5' RNA ligase
MGLAVELHFDREAERAVLSVWEAVRAAGGNGKLFDLRARPHVSLAVYPEGARGPAFAEAMAGRPLEHAVAAFRAAPLPFTLASAGTFPGEEGVVFLAPVVDDRLLRLHRDWHALAPGGMELYGPGVWVPHCTVGFHLKDVAPAVAVARAALPVRGRYESISLIEFDRDLARPVRCLLEQPLAPA